MNRQAGQEVWLPLLLAAKPRVVAITGGGGKTSLLYYLAGLLKQQGQKVIISLTTKMFNPSSEEHKVLFTDSIHSLTQVAHNVGSDLFTVAHALDPTDPRKLTGLPPDWFDQAQEAVPDVFFLIEADGSAGKPLKGYLPHEPVIPASTGLVIPVVGLDVLGKLLNDQYVHRAAVAAEQCGRQLNEMVNADVIVKLLQSSAGYSRCIPATAKTVFFLNKVETSAALASANSIADHLLTDLSSAVVIGSVHNKEFLLRLYDNFSSR